MCGLNTLPLCQHEIIWIHVFSSMGLGPGGTFGFLWLCNCLRFQDCLLEGEANVEWTASPICPGTRHLVCCSWCCCYRLWPFCPSGTHLFLSVSVNSFILAHCLPGLRSLPGFIFSRPFSPWLILNKTPVLLTTLFFLFQDHMHEGQFS